MKTISVVAIFISISYAPLQAEDLPSPLAPVVQSFVEQKIVPGVVTLVADRNGVLTVDRAGYASLAKTTPIRDDAVFWIASMSKSLTGTALMMLVDEGQVSLDDPVEKYLPEFKGQMIVGPDGTDTPRPPKHPITVREVMNHTSGLVLASDPSLKRTHVLKDDGLRRALAGVGVGCTTDFQSVATIYFWTDKRAAFPRRVFRRTLRRGGPVWRRAASLLDKRWC